MKRVSTEQWKRIDTIVDGALDLPEAERADFVARACGADEALRKEVMAMLGAGEVAGTFLENQQPELLGDMRSAVRKAAEPKDNLIGTHVGPYRLKRPIGRGGMGQVYLAVRDDESYTRYVAVKVIRRGMDTDEILNRFRQERRILASLAHPNIARLLDGGATEDGLSYFVMEYIEGEPIIEYCDARKMPVRERLKLFRKVCAAVQFAHQNLIVHRDLKPSNILVTPDGRPKLLDFGIAKVLNPNLAGYTVPMTQADMRVMTPEYASPEQMRGGAVTTASDVYQLGILLYELLTGSRPHDTSGRTRKEIEDIILTKDPERPSTAISQVSPETVKKRTHRDDVNALRKTLSGDLDRIVLMALRKEPDRRYPSVDLLQEDVRRFLEGLPVSAQADTLGYRASKFVQRHKVGVAASAALIALMIAVTVLAVRFALVTGEQAERIAMAATKTEQVSRFLVGTFQWADPDLSGGRDVTVNELVDRAVAQVDQELAGQPEVHSHMLMELGIAYREMGNLEAAGGLLERSLAMRRADPDTPPMDLAASLFHLGIQRDWRGDWQEAKDLHEEALAIRLEEEGPGGVEVARSYNALTAPYTHAGRAEEMVPLLEQALATVRQTEGVRNFEYGEFLSSLAYIKHELGLIQDSSDLLAEAEQAYRESLDIFLDVLGQEHPNVGSMYTNIGAFMQDTGQYAEAEQLHRMGFQVKQKVYGDRHTLVGNSVSHIARALYAQGRTEEAESLFREALARHLDTLGPDHPYVGRDRAILANLLIDTGETVEAERQLIQAMEVYRKGLPPTHGWITQAREALERLYAETGQEARSGLY
ncbi:MAG: serine/threonine protein kinase [Rhodothermales bacterium]|nr:serine/threonine protein kinase [Rhodothermales bacterium]MBO6778441.1 serine/threonine protein kinase [Rhodothermales bacterium]